MTTATKSETKTIGTIAGNGAYDFGYTHRLIEHNGTLYCVIDEWCGSGPEGECYRPHLYSVPESLRSDAMKAFGPDGTELDSEGYGTSDWTFFRDDLYQNGTSYGRQSRVRGALGKI